ncbi:hypothetical protein CDAR_527071 [Caerostris darwini]|uniref:Uncharacterized protein n=1 Tax=Caerostris darwini TaxID=1538125 RepID=A0AAV4WLP1_9ARAC|nr:hypothetical protein CDAR_527071 [Caerostris darwini]
MYLTLGYDSTDALLAFDVRLTLTSMYPTLFQVGGDRPESPPLNEQGIIPDSDTNNQMDTTITVTIEELNNTEFLLNHPAPRRLNDSTPDHLFYIEDL